MGKNLLNLKYEIEDVAGDDVDLITSLTDYDNGYICDLISEISDNNVDIYTNNLWDWARYNQDIVEDALAEMDFSSSNSLTDLFMYAQYMDNSNILYENIEDVIRYKIYDYLSDMEIIPLSLYDYINDIVSSTDASDKLDVILDDLDNFMLDNDIC